MCIKLLKYVSILLLLIVGHCSNSTTKPCVAYSKCDDSGECVVTNDATADDSCQTTITTNFFGDKTYSCSSNCSLKTAFQAASLSLQGGQTCAVTTTHSESFKTPGCWCYVPFVGDRCCFCGGGLCYITNTWTTTTYVPAPPYGNCP